MDREFEATFDSQGHFDLPIEVMQRHGLTNGSRVRIEDRKKEVVIKPVVDESERKRIALEAIDRAVGFLGTDGTILQDLMDDRKAEKERDDRAFGSR
jgi:bifunctional DNA-binding transcriptional regulator/antitoxin component of YhaV-PrlF toxin-antitoxin module